MANNLKNTSTDMMANLLANTEKLVNSENRWNYGDPHDDDQSELDDDVDHYVSENTQPSKNISENQQPPKNISDHPSNPTVFQKTTPNVIQNEKSAPSTQANDNEPEKQLTKEELSLIKLDTLRKLGELKQCGVHLSQNYGMDSDLKMMQYELKLHTDIRSKQNSVQWMSHMMIGCLKGVEMLNDNYNPFDIKLAGLTDKVSSDMHNYYMVLGDIYEKYNQPGKQMAPEMRLLLMLSGSALSMQASRIIPQMIPQLSGSVKNDEKLLNELREKAQNNTNNTKINEIVNREHQIANQKASDLQMIREKELEYQRMKQIIEKQSNDANIKSNLILSSDNPPQKNAPTKNVPTQNFQIPDPHLQQMKYIEEQKHLEQMRHLASIEHKKRDLQLQNAHLDNIMNGLDDDDTLSAASNKSSVSINPDINNIMKNKPKKQTKNKPKKQNKLSNKLDDQLDHLLNNDDYSFNKDELSFGSNNPKNIDKNNTIEISFGSNKKGSKPAISFNK